MERSLWEKTKNEKMTSGKTLLKVVSFLGIFCSTLFFCTKKVLGYTDTIGADVKISVCGNFEAEGGEDCDNDDLAGETCESIGYDGGDLFCDMACDFDFSGCFILPPEDSEPEEEDREKVNEEILTNLNVKGILPLTIEVFDIDKDGRIEISELFFAVKKWVQVWFEERDSGTCDLNVDGECNLIDFSVLMFYVEK